MEDKTLIEGDKPKYPLPWNMSKGRWDLAYIYDALEGALDRHARMRSVPSGNWEARCIFDVRKKRYVRTSW
jgi:hypothetical protein